MDYERKPTQIGIFGGTFNPPHLGHVRAVRAAGRALGLDQVLVVPAKLPPHKTLPEGGPSPEDRLQMTRLAFRYISQVAVVDIELKREGPSYTVDTVASLSRLYPNSDLWLILGDDAFMTLREWRRPAELFGLCKIGVLMRSAEKRARVAREARLLGFEFSVEVSLVDHAVLEASSTEIRAALEKNEEPILLPTTVEAYIREKGLYGGLGRD